MSEQEAVNCPFCGAPYTEVIPNDVTHVKCKYCKSIILLPSNLSVVPRCPNHTDTIAIGLCNDCMQAFCKKCLHIYNVRGGKIHLCSNCLRNRQTNQIYALIAGGVIMFLLSLLGLQFSILMFIVSFLIFSLPFIAGGLYIFFSMKHAPNLDTYPTLQKLQEKREKLGTISIETESLYWRLWREHVRSMGIIGPTILERRIHDYINQGLTLNEAIKKLAKIERIT